MLKAYPHVVSEAETLERILAGQSIARFGDGEFKMAGRHAGIKSQVADDRLSDRLSEILIDSGDCMVGIPNIHAVISEHVSDQKVEHWSRHLVFRNLLVEREYVSAFITRADSAPWINTSDYWQAFEQLWIGQDVTIVRGSGKSFKPDDLIGAGTVTEIITDRQHAWAKYDEILARVLSVKPRRVLIGLGPTATVLAVDLCARGIHALDLGHAALFLRKYRRGETDTRLSDVEKYGEMPA